MTWAQMGFDASPLAPVEDAVMHLCHALEERINNHYGQETTEIFVKDSIVPIGVVFNQLLYWMRPDHPYDPPEWLSYTPVPVAPMPYQLFTTDNWANGPAWCTATIADYYARMNALAGFDISQDVNPLAPITSAMVNGLKNAINSIHCEIDSAQYVHHTREFEYNFDEDLGQWVAEYSPWQEHYEDMSLWLHHWVVEHTSTWQGEVTTWYTGEDGWMLEGDGMFWDPYGRTGLTCKAMGIKIQENSYPTAPLSSYSIGQYYVWPAPVGSARINPCAGYSPMPPGTAEVVYELLAWPDQFAVVDYGGTLDYYDPPTA